MLKHIGRIRRGFYLAASSLALMLCAERLAPLEAETTEFPPSKVYATAWGLTLSTDGGGFYNDLGRYVLQGLNIDYDIEPYRRAMRSFYEEQSSCVYPKSILGLIRTKDIDNSAGFIQSVPIQRTFVAVFAPPGKPAVRGPEELAGKRVAYAMGAKVPEYLGAEGAFFIAVANELDKARMLLTGRVDVMVGNLPDAGLVYSHLGSALPPYDPSYRPFPAASSRIVCHDTPGNRAFMDQLNRRILSLHQSGDLKRFYEGFGLNAGLYLDRLDTD